eukprot:CAMPEP_0185911478 /NCGR_PEP_ID=MMETSP0196C-20130402/29459_1 /TAXON_ID=2932 /ORGANISM="Alexandrium fundyense, Strain CCMP1719" /LENGTH=44 /DNA_ID= /DNA_START= /DNA_END= /DNA_ORIENTATION=
MSLMLTVGPDADFRRPDLLFWWDLAAASDSESPQDVPENSAMNT